MSDKALLVKLAGVFRDKAGVLIDESLVVDIEDAPGVVSRLLLRAQILQDISRACLTVAKEEE